MIYIIYKHQVNDIPPCNLKAACWPGWTQNGLTESKELLPSPELVKHYNKPDWEALYKAQLEQSSEAMSILDAFWYISERMKRPMAIIVTEKQKQILIDQLLARQAEVIDATSF